MPAWPAYLPAPEKDSIELTGPRGAVIRTQSDTGPAATRPRFTAAPRGLSMSFAPVSATDIAAFEAYFVADLAMGALPFDMAHPVTGATVSLRFEGDPGYSMKEIGKMPDGGEDSFRLSVTLELLP